MMEVIYILPLLFLVACALTAVLMKDLLGATIILGAYSLIMAVVWTMLNAVDVAFTEASVGAGITTVLMVAALSRTVRGEYEPPHEARGWKRKRFSITKVSGFFVVVLTAAAMIYGTMDMPDFGDPNAPANLHVARRYIEESRHETGVPNFVTAVLASYRGYDTLGETTVIFTAGMSVILLLRRIRRE